jgi:hypothetical protein
MSTEHLEQLIAYLTPTEWNQVIEERSLMHNCGWPLCSNKLEINAVPKIYVSKQRGGGGGGDLYGESDSNFFCKSTKTCMKYAYGVRKLLDVEPLWNRSAVIARRHALIPSDAKSPSQLLRNVPHYANEVISLVPLPPLRLPWLHAALPPATGDTTAPDQHASSTTPASSVIPANAGSKMSIVIKEHDPLPQPPPLERHKASNSNTIATVTQKQDTTRVHEVAGADVDSINNEDDDNDETSSVTSLDDVDGERQMAYRVFDISDSDEDYSMEGEEMNEDDVEAPLHRPAAGHHKAATTATSTTNTSHQLDFPQSQEDMSLVLRTLESWFTNHTREWLKQGPEVNTTSNASSPTSLQQPTEPESNGILDDDVQRIRFETSLHFIHSKIEQALDAVLLTPAPSPSPSPTATSSLSPPVEAKLLADIDRSLITHAIHDLVATFTFHRSVDGLRSRHWLAVAFVLVVAATTRVLTPGQPPVSSGPTPAGAVPTSPTSEWWRGYLSQSMMRYSRMIQMKPQHILMLLYALV